MNKEVFWLYKTAALLHDPPDKAWVITGRIDFARQLNKINDKDIKAHEDRARQLSIKILDGTSLIRAPQDYSIYFFSSKIKNCDNFAASIDRILLSAILTKEEEHELVKSLKIKNIFDPSKELELKEKIEENQLNNFIKQLNSIIKGINDTKLEYFIL
jgi:CRISPR-associated protein Cmr2